MAEQRGLGEEYAIGSANNINRMMKGVSIVAMSTKDLFKVGLLMADIFTKFVSTIPLENDTTPTIMK